MATALKLQRPEQPDLTYPIKSRIEREREAYRAAKRRKVKKLMARAVSATELMALHSRIFALQDEAAKLLVELTNPSPMRPGWSWSKKPISRTEEEDVQKLRALIEERDLLLEKVKEITSTTGAVPV